MNLPWDSISGLSRPSGNLDREFINSPAALKPMTGILSLNQDVVGLQRISFGLQGVRPLNFGPQANRPFRVWDDSDPNIERHFLNNAISGSTLRTYFPNSGSGSFKIEYHFSGEAICGVVISNNSFAMWDVVSFATRTEKIYSRASASDPWDLVSEEDTDVIFASTPPSTFNSYSSPQTPTFTTDDTIRTTTIGGETATDSLSEEKTIAFLKDLDLVSYDSDEIIGDTSAGSSIILSGSPMVKSNVIFRFRIIFPLLSGGGMIGLTSYFPLVEGDKYRFWAQWVTRSNDPAYGTSGSPDHVTRKVTTEFVETVTHPIDKFGLVKMEENGEPEGWEKINYGFFTGPSVTVLRGEGFRYQLMIRGDSGPYEITWKVKNMLGFSVTETVEETEVM
jgi:hypothetical protein